MERNAEKMIRQKVAEAEGISVVWRRERVWENISVQEKPATSHRIFYYAAASLLILVAGGVYFLQWQHDREVEQRIAALEAKLHRRIVPSTVSVASKQSCIETISTAAKTSAAYPASFMLEAHRENFTNVIPDPAELVVSAEEKEPLVLITAEPEEVIVETVLKTVQPIIGFIPPGQEKPVVAKIKSKPHFRLFYQPQKEPVTIQPEDTHTLSARIN